MGGHRFSVERGAWTVVWLTPDAPLPVWADAAPFCSLTRAADELSLVVPAEHVPAAARAERDWALLKLAGPFAFGEPGILASVTGPLAAARVGLFAISTFNTDYVLVKQGDLPAALAALERAGHVRIEPTPARPAPAPAATPIGLRTDLRPGDIGEVVRLHGRLYAREYGFDRTFEAYVAGPLAEVARRGSPRERLWLAENGEELVGSIAMVEAAADTAQLRWFLVAPGARGHGLGGRLIEESLAFARTRGYREVILWTVSALSAAAHLYRKAGFRLVESRPEHIWGTDVVEERYSLRL